MLPEINEGAYVCVEVQIVDGQIIIDCRDVSRL